MFKNLYEGHSCKRVQLHSLPNEIDDEEGKYILPAQAKELPQGLIEDEI